MPQTTATRLFERHHLSVFRLLRHLTGSRQEAEDLTQEVFVRALRALDAFRPEGRDLAWLLRIARNLWIDRGRRRARRPGLVALPANEPAARGGPELRLDLEEALAALPEAEREAFLLREVAGLSYAEIGDLTETSDAGVRSRIFRARRTLRASLRPRTRPDLEILR